jgi:hypothetical protein
MAFPPRPPHTRIVRYWSGRRLVQVTCFPLAARVPPPPVGVGPYQARAERPLR